MKTLIVDTVPKNARNTNSINLGLEIVAKNLDADVCQWWEKVDIIKYDKIGFNVFYPMHLLNISPFLKKNNIVKGKGIELIAGGQGIGDNGILSQIVDSVFIGDIDDNQKELLSEPVIKGDKAVIELTRGCRKSCNFCEYSHNRKYIEKPIELVEQQIIYIKSHGIKDMNFMSANFAGYSKLDQLMELCKKYCVRVLNSDSCLSYVPRLFPYLQMLPRCFKMGIESFDYKTRVFIGKPFTDDFFESTIDRLLDTASVMHFYLIYGLPGDDYDKWFEWIDKLGKLNKSDRFIRSNNCDLWGNKYKEVIRPLRFDFLITNFEPCDNTPFQDMPLVDFKEKEKFMVNLMKVLYKAGFYVQDTIEYRTCTGLMGRKELSYKMLMVLKKSGVEATEALRLALPSGVGRSVSDEEAQKFLNIYGKGV